MISVVQRPEPRNSSHMQESERRRFRDGHAVVADKFRNRRIAVRIVLGRSGVYQVRRARLNRLQRKLNVSWKSI